PGSAEVFQTTHASFLYKNGRVETAGMNRHHRRTLKNKQNLFTLRASRDSCPDMAAHSIWVEVRANGIPTDTDQFDKLEGQNTSRPGTRRHTQGLLRPGWI